MSVSKQSSNRFSDWLMLCVLSGATSTLLIFLRLPAWQMLGPMAAGVLVAATGRRLNLCRGLGSLAQASIACLIVQTIDAAAAKNLVRYLPVAVAVAAATLTSSIFIGRHFSRLGIIAGTTPIWGMMPGVAPIMIVMAENAGADARLVAFMQYLRLALVALTVAFVARLWLPHSPQANPEYWFGSVDWGSFGWTMLLMTCCISVSGSLAIRSGAFVLTLGVAAICQSSGVMTLTLPMPFLGACYVMLGWKIGLQFDRSVMAAAARAFPKVVSAVVLLMMVCGVLAALLAYFLGVDPLTAYLATSPGGLDAITIIAHSSRVDAAFIVAMQTVRFLATLTLGPALAALSRLDRKGQESTLSKS